MTVATSPLLRLPIRFVGSFPDPAVKLDPPMVEFAFVGRSNVGKSSLLNALVGRPGLARVSSTPGKTTLINVFQLPDFYLVDLPGYGFAKASKTAREGYRKLLHQYLAKRGTLGGVVWLLDIRHAPSAEDRAVQEQLVESGRPVLVVLTKADKLGRMAVRARVAELAADLGVEPDQLQVTSAAHGAGIAELAESLLDAARHPSA